MFQFLLDVDLEMVALVFFLAVLVAFGLIFLFTPEGRQGDR
jgi:hypothetical protein